MFICIVGSFLSGHNSPYTTELFPSTVRGFVIGFWTVAGNLLGSIIPYVGLVTEKMKVHFLSGFIPFSVLAFAFSFLMPETINDTLQN